MLTLEEIIKWVLFVFMGGFLVFAIRNFVDKMQELANLFQDLKQTVNQLQLMITNNNDRTLERDRSINNHLEKHDRYIKDVWKTVNSHDTDIELIKSELKHRL